MISTSELTEIREAALDLLPDTCQILSSTYTPDGQGGGTITWGTAVADVKCRLDSMQTNKEAFAGEAITPTYNYMLDLPYSTTIDTTQRVSVNSETFAVVSVDVGKSWAITKLAYMEIV